MHTLTPSKKRLPGDNMKEAVALFGWHGPGSGETRAFAPCAVGRHTE
jgi:hypothetical protein